MNLFIVKYNNRKSHSTDSLRVSSYSSHNSSTRHARKKYFSPINRYSRSSHPYSRGTLNRLAPNTRFSIYPVLPFQPCFVLFPERHHFCLNDSGCCLHGVDGLMNAIEWTVCCYYSIFGLVRRYIFILKILSL